MDNELENLEAELKRLRPAPSSARLTARVGRELAAAPARRLAASIHWLWAAMLPAAAAAVAMFVQFVPPAGRAVAVPALAAVDDAPLKPVAAENVLVAARDEGLVTLDDGTPARRERRHYVDTIVWKNPRTHASLTWTVPREEVRIVPVVFQ